MFFPGPTDNKGRNFGRWTSKFSFERFIEFGERGQMNATHKAAKYRETDVKTGGKEKILLKLFEGAISFSKQGKKHVQEENIEEAHEKLVRAQRIMLELIAAIDEDMMPDEIFDNLVGLYDFVYNRLVQANMDQEVEPIDEALTILDSLYETWQEAVERMRQEQNESIPEAEDVSVSI